MEDRFKEEKYKAGRKKLKRYENGFLYAFITIFLIGYGFFFLSPYILPKTYEGVRITNIGETVNVNDRKITLDDWTYSKKQKAMEIVIETDSYSVDGINEYNYEVRDKNKAYKIKEVLNSDGLTVIRAYKIPKDWTEVVLRIGLTPEDREKNEEFTTIKIYMNDLSVRNVDEIRDRTEKEYLVDSYNLRISIYQDRIKEIDQEISEYEMQKEEADKRIKELEDSMKNQTENEKKETSSNISNLKINKESMDNMIGSLTDEKNELEEKIDILTNQVKEIE